MEKRKKMNRNEKEMANCEGCSILKRRGTRCVCVIIEYEMCASGKLIDLYVCIEATCAAFLLGQPSWPVREL